MRKTGFIKKKPEFWPGLKLKRERNLICYPVFDRGWVMLVLPPQPF